MTEDVYRKLARHLDNLPGGFPPTESGVEQRILRRLFAPEDAELALSLTLIAEEPRVIAHRARIPVREAARRLEELAKKGLIFSYHREGKPPRYQAVQWVVGIWEHQVNNLDPGLVQDFDEYLSTAFDPDVWKATPQLRTIPVGESIKTQVEVMAYERAEALVRAQEKIAVAPCICRRERKIAGEGCDKPEETCLIFGVGADYWVRNGMGRTIEQDEALAILVRAEEAGLVLQPGNQKESVNICCCCGCCCGVLRSVKRQPRPASLVASPFVAVLEADACEGCGLCETRCQMEAVWLDDGRAVLDPDRCIGCGLCVTTCPAEALSLARKPEAQQPTVPKDITETYIRLGRARGKMGMGDLAGMLIKSKVDRLLAPR
jgi:ferredoxin